MYIGKRWLVTLLLLIVIGGAAYFFLYNTQVNAQIGGDRGNNNSNAASAAPATIAIQPANALISEVSAAGNISLVEQKLVAADVSGLVNTVHVRVGDQVAAGDLLLVLDTVALERAAKRAELTVDAQRNNLAQLSEPADDAELALAEANLASAQENLADVLAGPSAAEIAAARSSLSSAWSKYNELQAGPSQAELTQLSASLKKAEVALAESRRSYDRVAWRNDVGMTSEAAALQDATIDYESAKASYEQSVAAAANSEVQSAVSSAQNAQAQLDTLLNSPTEAEIATAKAQVADAEKALADLKAGPNTSDLRAAQISLEQALVDLEEAYANLAAAQVTAPVAGTVLAVAAEVGQRVSEGTTVVTLADTGQLELTINVAELDVPQITVGQPAAVEVDALSGQSLVGEVVSIAPSSDSSSGVVYYPVTIRLTDDELAGVRPGMTAVATIKDTSTASDGWLVPTASIQQQNGEAVVLVVSGETTTPVVVTPGAIQGEWTVVQSAELQAGDQVVGSVASYLDRQQSFGPGSGGPPGGGQGGPPR
ncbi:MAG: efflux RND transporter periplasmic adaptor subunit [Caldilineaceae bacterium]|nr:efflux RND transporter periplasmic adaptor subunit [Caldilineaceae bacterium]